MKQLIYITSLLFSCVVFSQQIEYDVFSTNINSKYAELGVSYFKNNEVIFASSKKNDKDKAFTSDRRKTNKQLFLELYTGKIEEGNITTTKLFTSETNNRYFESDITFSADFKTVYFTWNNFFNTRTRQDSAKWKTLHLVKAKFGDNNKIMQIEPLPFNNPEYSIRNPELSANGKQLFFSSDMPGGSGGYDIFVVAITENGFGTPQNLGPAINTAGDEMFPFPDGAGNLYFASNGHRGLGNFDIYKSELNDGIFKPAQGLPSPINSKYDDFGFVLNTEENKGFITSNRKGGLGDVDIYRFDVRITGPTCNQRIEGEIVDAVNDMKLTNAQVLIYKNEELLEEKHLHGGNTFSVNLECNSSYKFVFKKNFFSDQELRIDTDQLTDTVLNETIRMRKSECKKSLSGQVIHSRTKTPLTNVLLKVYEEQGALLETVTVSNLFSLNTLLSCNKNYRLVASKENFKTKVSTITISALRPIDQREIFALEPVINIITVRGERMIKTEPIHFELNEYEITEEAVEELDKLVTFLKKNPTIKIAVRNHTDSRAPDAYNLTLTTNRANAIVDFLRSKGIAHNRVTGKGFGETKPLNNCKNGVDCTEAEYEINKRTEFVILTE